MGLRVALALIVLLAIGALLLRPWVGERRDVSPRAAAPVAEVARTRDSTGVVEADGTARVALDAPSSGVTTEPSAPSPGAGAVAETLEGTAETVEGEPLEGVRVRAVHSQVFEACSDALGRFAFATARFESQIEAAKSGWTLVERTGGGRDAGGRPRPVRLVFAPSAQLHVRIVDAAGRGRAGERVIVSVSPEERFGSSPGRDLEHEPWFVAIESDAQGIATFLECPAELRLVVRRAGEEYPRVEGQRLSRSTESTSSSPIVLHPGDVCGLELRLGRSLRVRGRVTMQDGRLAAGAMVTLALRRQPELPAFDVDTAFTDDEARFGFDVLPAHEPIEVELCAEAGENGRLPHGMFQIKRPDPLHVARLRRPWPHEPDATWDVELVLQRGGTIAGTVLDVEGRPTSAQGELIAETGDERPCTRQAGREGELRFSGLLEPSYALVVSKPGRATVRLGGLVPDGGPFTVRLTEPASARVVVRVTSAEDLEQTVVLAAELVPFPRREVAAPDLPASTSVAEPRGWPAGVVDLWDGGMMGVCEDGGMECSLTRIDGSEHAFEIDGGLWWFGAQARARDGNLLFPVGTGLVRVTPGEHVVDLLLLPTGSLAGRHAGAEPAGERWVALARPGSAPIELDVRADALSPVHRCASDGSFAWPMVPVGVLELRWGTREELLAGRAAGSRAVEVRRGETTRVEIEP